MHSLTSALDGGEWSASRPGRFLSPGKDPLPSTHWLGGWVGSRAGLDAVVWRKFISLQNFNLKMFLFLFYFTFSLGGLDINGRMELIIIIIIIFLQRLGQWPVPVQKFNF
jgi:hypothetical protein